MFKLDPREFRNALGTFATGVTVITTCAEDNSPVGVTANSFSSVSLEPPLVLWSLSRASHSLSAFKQAGEFAVHVLSAHQEDLSRRFASRFGADKFTELEFERSSGGAPLLSDCVARFRCQTRYQYEAGDHVIIVGEVLDYHFASKPPLLFHSGRYVETRERCDTPDCFDIDLGSGRFTEDFLLYLLALTYHQVERPVLEAMKQAELELPEQMTLTQISIHGPISLEAIRARVDASGQAPTQETIRLMQQRGLLHPESPDGLLSITDKGRERFLFVLSRIKIYSDALIACLAPAELAEGARFLKQLLAISSKQPSPWLEPRHR